ncbi:MAG TPA: RNA polymerase factor sigma-54 [Opitutales bacterium]|jgi:RNA polymerase sigma-54 factor|nr:RNA polymerase factor sigma-54 [Opitutales bacterium]
MAQGLHQVQKLTQNQVLAPQLRQSLKILQAPALELRHTILEELQNNPLLEEMAINSVSLEEQAEEHDPERNGDGDTTPEANEEMRFQNDFEILRKLDEDWRDHFQQNGSQNVHTRQDAERRQHFFDSLVSETSLQEHLLSQADLADGEEGVREALRFLVGSLNDQGFLTSTPSDIALLSNLPLKTVQDAAELLKTFDPPGIGAANVQESLLQQLKIRGQGDCLASNILRHHYPLLLRRRIPEIARKVGADLESVQEALEEIATLDPAPGRRFGEDTNRVVEPDVRVEQDGDRWVITLNRDYIPRLRLSATYKELLAKNHLSPQEKEYISEKMRSGKFLISSIEQRQQTIERITKEILAQQKDFFEHGVSKLRPLTMNQVAQAVGVHETTVSRAIANKYIATPWGVFDFKFFFTPGYTGQNGETLSNTSIKDRIAQIVSEENPAKPFSDQDIVAILGEKDVNIARRTVAKYREELGILPTNLRRRYA